MLGIAPNNFASLIYNNPSDSLSGLSVNQVLDKANLALAGLGLPTGYTFDSLAALMNNLNVAFLDSSTSTWAAIHLSDAALLVQCAGQVPGPSVASVTASDSCSTVTVSSLPDAIVGF